MKFQAPFFLIASLITLVTDVVGEHRTHPRDFPLDVYPAAQSVHLEDRFQLSKRAPQLPDGADDSKLHVWLRIDTRPLTYDDRGGARHDGLNQLMKDTGGRHADVVVGNSRGYHEYGLQFNDNTWQSKPNGDGAAVSAYTGVYDSAPGEEFTYQGRVGDGRRTLLSIGTLARTEINGKTYNHNDYNCRTFADNLVGALNVVR